MSERQEGPATVFGRVPLWACLLICGFGLAALGILTLERPLIHRGNLDPLIYQAYIFDYDDLVARYGYTYFSSRVAWIFPSALAQDLLGPVTGFLVIRILILGGAASAMAFLVARFCRWPFAVYAAAWVGLSPLFLRGFAHEYVDGAAVSYAIVGMALVFTAKPRALPEHVFGGVFFALSVNAYTTAAVVPACLAIPWFLLRRRVDEGANIACILAAMAGFFAAYLGVAAMLWHVFSQAGHPFEVFPFGKIGSLVGGEAANWWTPLSEVFLARGEYFKGYPLFLALGLGLTALAVRPLSPAQDTSSDREMAAVLALLCGLMAAVYLALHFIIKTGVVSIPYGYVYALPVCGLAAAWLLDRLTPQRFVAPVCVFGVALFLASISEAFIQVWLATPKIVWLLAGAAVAVSGLAFLRPGFKPAAVIGVAGSLLLPMGFYATDYGGCLQNQTHRSSYVACMRQGPDDVRVEEALRRGTFSLLDDVEAVVPVHQKPGFWYAAGVDFADQIDISFLQYGGVASARNMPALEGYATSVVAAHDYLVLVARSPNDVDAGLRSLRAKGLAIDPLRRRAVGDANFAFSYAIVRLR